jgi:hypothetical protein
MDETPNSTPGLPAPAGANKPAPIPDRQDDIRDGDVDKIDAMSDMTRPHARMLHS